MDWTDLYLRTETEQDFRAACPFLVDSEGDWLTAVPEWLLDVIGPIVTEPAIHDEAGNEVVPAVIDERFHANLRCTVEVAALVPVEITTNPEHPGRVFAGDPSKAPPRPPIEITAEVLFFDRMTDAEYDALNDSVRSGETARVYRGWTAATSFTEGTAMWTLLDKHLSLVVTARRKAELLARPVDAEAFADEAMAA